MTTFNLNHSPVRRKEGGFRSWFCVLVVAVLSAIVLLGTTPARIAAQNATPSIVSAQLELAPASSPTVEPTIAASSEVPVATPTPVPSQTSAVQPTPAQQPTSTPRPVQAVQFSAAALGTATLPFTVSLSPSATVLAGANVAASATWSSAPAGRATGTMTYTAFVGTGCTGAVYASGGTNTLSESPALLGSVASSSSVSFGSSGGYSWQASYSGDANYAALSACANLTVNAYSPTLTLAVTPASSPMKAGGSVTGTVTLTSASAAAGGTVTYTVYANSGCTTPFAVTNSPSAGSVTNGISTSSAAVTFDHIGTYYWKAAYSGDGANNTASSSCVSLVVAKSTPAAVLSVAGTTPPLVAGGAAVGSVTLPGITSVAGGTVTYTVYTNNTCSTQISPAQTSAKTVVAGVVPNSDSFTYATAGTRYWRAVYSGDTNNTGATSSCVALVVAKTSPILTMTLNVTSPITAGTSVTGNATLTSQSGAAGGSVVYAVYADALCTTQTNPALTSTKTVTAGVIPASTAQIHNLAGTFYWKASYGGDSSNNAASSGCLALSVSKSNPSVSLTIAANSPPMVAGNSARGTATLTGATTTASGTATYSLHSDAACTIPLSATGSTNARTLSGGLIPVSSSMTINVAGTVYWKVAYPGDANNNAAVSSCVPFSVAKRSPSITVAITAQATPMKVGGTATGRGSLSGAISTAGGTAVYTVYSDNACSTALTANNSPSTVNVTNRSVATSARITIDLAGTVYWRVVYSGDANHNGAQSPCTSQTVAKSNPSLALTVAPTVSPMRTGGTASGRVTMTLAGTTASGALTYTVYSNSSCSNVLTSPGSPSVVTVANRTVPNSAAITINIVGTVYWRASYAGDTNNNAANSSCISQTVSKAAPAISLTVTASSVPMRIGGTAFGSISMSSGTANAGGVLTYTLYSNSGCTTTATNVVGSPSSVTVTNQIAPNSALMTINFVGTIYWKAAYAGDTNNNSASSSCLSLVVGKKQPSLSIVVVPVSSPMRAGGSAVGSSTLSNASPTAGGSVTYTVFSDNLCSLPLVPVETSTVPVNNGVVPSSSPILFNTVGTYFWNASYTGDSSNETALSSCQSLTVAANGATSIDLIIVPDPVIVRTSFAGSVSITGTTSLAGGTVIYSIYTDPICSTPLAPAQNSTVNVVNSVAPASASFTIDAVGTLYMNAVYSGDASNVGSTSACNVVAIVKATPSIALSLSPSSIVVGFSTTASAVMSNSSSNLTGSVTYAVYTDNGCSVPVTPALSSTKTPDSGLVPDSDPFTISVIGAYFVGATFAGDGENNAASSGCAAFSVTTAFPELTLVLSPNPVQIGETFGAQMALSANAINPTGSVELRSFTDSSCTAASPDVASYTLTLASGLIPAAPAVSLASSGVLYRQAVYSGDVNNASAVSDCLAQVIDAGQLSASIVSATLTPIGYSNFASTNNGTLVIQVNDDRETGDGWSVSVIASDFEYSGISSNGNDISASGFSVVSTGAPVVLLGQGIGTGGPYSNSNAIGSLDEIRTLIVAESGFGAGRYQMSSTLSLDIPAQSQAGTYTSTLTISTSAAP